MNYSVPSRRSTSAGSEPEISRRINTVMERIQIIFSPFKHIFGLIIGFLLFILQDVFGINVVGLCGSLCTILTCGSVLVVSSSIAVAVGVRLGLGLNCAQTQYYPIRYITDTINTTNPNYQSRNTFSLISIYSSDEINFFVQFI